MTNTYLNKKSDIFGDEQAKKISEHAAVELYPTAKFAMVAVQKFNFFLKAIR